MDLKFSVPVAKITLTLKKNWQTFLQDLYYSHTIDDKWNKKNYIFYPCCDWDEKIWIDFIAETGSDFSLAKIVEHKGFYEKIYSISLTDDRWDVKDISYSVIWNFWVAGEETGNIRFEEYARTGVKDDFISFVDDLWNTVVITDEKLLYIDKWVCYPFQNKTENFAGITDFKKFPEKVVIVWNDALYLDFNTKTFTKILQTGFVSRKTVPVYRKENFLLFETDWRIYMTDLTETRVLWTGYKIYTWGLYIGENEGVFKPCNDMQFVWQGGEKVFMIKK